MKLKRVMILICLVGLLGLMTACTNDNNQQDNSQQAQDNLNQTGFPIVEDEITLDFFTAIHPEAPDWNDDFPAWKQYQDMTNINIDWIEQVSSESLGEKRNLILASGDLPDAFFAAGFTNSDLFKYGEQGSFIDLKDLIDDYAPNLKQVLEENPDIEKGITFPDGNIYSLPSIKDADFLGLRLGGKQWIDETWLDRLNMENPETTEEFYEFLTAVKEEDPNTIPFGSYSINTLVSALSGSFGLNNTGFGDNAAEGGVDLDPEGDGLRFIGTTDRYREMLEYVHKLYDEELIAQNIFSIEWGDFISGAGSGDYASFTFWNPVHTIGGEIAENFISFFPLEGPHGDKLYTHVDSPLNKNGQFVITSENEYPAETMRWIDYFYGDDGAKLMDLGIEGESYVEEDGKYVFSELVQKAEGVPGPEDKLREFAPGGGLNTPSVVKEAYYIGAENREDSLAAAERIKPYLPDEIWPQFTYTKEENEFIASQGHDITKYVTEMRDKFIAGDEPINDENWQQYVETVEKMNLDEYMEIKEAAYERYSAD